MGESKQVAANTNTVPSVRFPFAHFVRVVFAWVRRHVTVEDVCNKSRFVGFLKPKLVRKTYPDC